MRQNIVTFSLAGYPALVRQLTRLVVDLDQATDCPILTVALFGSVARLLAGQSSDADLLALHAEDASEEQAAIWLIQRLRMVRDAEDSETSDDAGWQMIPVFGNARASDLDPDFLASVAQDGVLLFQRPGTKPPSPLAHLRSFSAWRQDVSALMAALRLAASHLSSEERPSASGASR